MSGWSASKEEAIRALAAAGWYPADAVTLKTSIEIAGSVIFDRPYRDAPVSPLFYEGREQDFAFEKPVGNERRPAQPRALLADAGEGRSGQAGLPRLGDLRSRRRLQPLHRRDHPSHRARHRRRARSPDRRPRRGEDADRDLPRHRHRPDAFGRNGGGDPYYTDGEITIGVVRAGAMPTLAPPTILPDPQIISAKNAIWEQARRLATSDDWGSVEGGPR